MVHVFDIGIFVYTNKRLFVDLFVELSTRVVYNVLFVMLNRHNSVSY